MPEQGPRISQCQSRDLGQSQRHLPACQPDDPSDPSSRSQPGLRTWYSCVGPCNEPLRGSLLVASGAIDLPCQVQSPDALGLKGLFQLTGVHIVIFHCRQGQSYLTGGLGVVKSHAALRDVSIHHCVMQASCALETPQAESQCQKQQLALGPSPVCHSRQQLGTKSS